MKALTLTEPWATLMAYQAKKIETRSWRLPNSIIGQEVAIHAAKGFPRWAKEACDEEPFTILHTLNVKVTPGHVICVVKFNGCRMTEDVREQITPQEFAFGDYGEGRWAWFSEFVRKLDTPMPAIGHLGFWEWARELKG